MGVTPFELFSFRECGIVSKLGSLKIQRADNIVLS